MHATYCLNGHYVGNPSAANPRYRSAVIRTRTIVDPIDVQQPAAFCTQCGQKSISECQNQSCQARIEVSFGGTRPDYCGGCGKPLPWTELALATAKEYADELDELSHEDKAALKGTFDDLTKDTPRTQLAASRFKKYMTKIGPVAADAFKKILFDVLDEGAKKMMGL
jgi:hypothetical protein